MPRFKEKIIFLKNKLFSNKLYLYGLLGILFIFGLVILYFTARPERPEIPWLPQGDWTENLIAYWAFDEKVGQIAYDAFSRIHNGRLGRSDRPDTADPQRFKKGKIGRALKFDGRDDYLIVIDHPDLRVSQEVTIEGWFKVLGFSTANPSPIWLRDFQYRKQIIIDNTKSRESFSNLQLLVTIDTASLISQGKVQSECQDIRFTDSDETTLLHYWIESGCNTPATKIWVRVPQLSAGLTKSLYFYYGNAEALSQSDFYKTMEIPPVKWWDYPLLEEDLREGKEIRGMAVDADNNIIVVGSDKEERELQWRAEKIGPRGFLERRYLNDPSSGADEINNLAVDLENKIILGGYDALPGDLQWRAEKLTSNFSFDWAFTSNFSPGSDEIKAVAVDSENNILLAGYDSVPGNAQWRLVKLNSQGQKIWEYSINPSDKADVIVDIAVDSRNNILLAGYEKSLGNDRWRVEKLDPKGKLLYSYRLDFSDGADVINAIVVDSKDNVIAVGYDFFPGDAQWRIIKLDEKGKRIWQWSFNPSPGFDEVKGVGVDSEDNIIVAGYDSTAGDFGWRIMKFSPDGEKIWEWTYNPSRGFDEVKDMIVDSENNIILAGYDFSLKKDPYWRVTKFSERKPLFPQPPVLIGEEKTIGPVLNNIILAKPGSYQVLATQNQITGIINRSSLFARLRNKDWNHFALTYDGTRLKLYLNGTLVNSQALTGEIITNFNNIFIGYNFTGLIDELKIYRKALSPQEVRFLYNKRDK